MENLEKEKIIREIGKCKGDIERIKAEIQILDRRLFKNPQIKYVTKRFPPQVEVREFDLARELDLKERKSKDKGDLNG